MEKSRKAPPPAITDYYRLRVLFTHTHALQFTGNYTQHSSSPMEVPPVLPVKGPIPPPDNIDEALQKVFAPQDSIEGCLSQKAQPSLLDLYDDAFHGPVEATSATLLAGSSKIRDCCAAVIEEMKKLSDASSVGGVERRVGGSVESETLVAFKEAVADFAKQLDVLRRQEALADFVAELKDTGKSGLASARAAQTRLRHLIESFPA